MEGKDWEVRVKFDINYLVLAGVESGSEASRASLVWCHLRAEQRGWPGRWGADVDAEWTSCGNPRPSELDKF